ncbi:DUF2599 domain-containing protein [Isoptericola sp. S6320L]|uniref:DUF2599 domain-containing protein n=1 Tax=Isoptericola sp. S6320L TaxID=2926411 RepID=UPI001FF21AF6|nr:DUF2599 domain-containing protein [Isoptericola sp. S6320L]MCK0117724.1 DUF2599 domain-containing protein [Isoptericola sp. S6320L]
MCRLPLLTVVVACSLLGACTAQPDAPAPAPSASASAAAAPPSDRPAPEPSDAALTEVSSGGTTLTVSVPTGGGARAVEVVPADGTVTVRVGTAPEAPATITLTSAGSVEVNVDSSVTILDDGGTPVAGLSPVAGGAVVTAVDTTSVRLDPPPEASTAETVLGTEAVASADWGEREGGRSLAVDPTAWARSAGQAGTDLVWAELVASDPEVDTPIMHDQLVCHSIGAPEKDTWNLEPWRPDVGLIAVLTDRCNPTE